MKSESVILRNSSCFTYEDSIQEQTLRQMPLLEFLRETGKFLKKSLRVFVLAETTEAILTLSIISTARLLRKNFSERTLAMTNAVILRYSPCLTNEESIQEQTLRRMPLREILRETWN